MKLHDLKPAPGATHSSKRLGKGRGTGQGGTAGKGHKGHQSRGRRGNSPAWFEGGQMPLQRRLPKRGFTNKWAKDVQIVNVGLLDKHFEAGATIDAESLAQKRLVRSASVPVKLLAKGETAHKYTVKVNAASDAARKSIESAGGSVEIVSAR